MTAFGGGRSLGREPLFFAAGLALAFSHACASGDDDLHELTLCDPGENIFCRCEGGEPGTKACEASGDSFGECGPCAPRESTGPGAQASNSSNATGTATSTGAGGASNTAASSGSGTASGTTSTASGAGGSMMPGTTGLLDPCDDDGDCQSLMCRHAFCTKPCSKPSECPWPASECVPQEGAAICMAQCDTAASCAPYGAPPSQCGFAKAIDAWGVTVCGHFGANHALMPLGTDCLPFDHSACNLGYVGRERVCTAAGVCAAGCFSAQDCPAGKTCSAPGNALGTCN